MRMPNAPKIATALFDKADRLYQSGLCDAAVDLLSDDDDDEDRLAAIDVIFGDPTALQVIPFWDMTLGPWEFTQAEPLIEVDLIEVDEGRVGYRGRGD